VADSTTSRQATDSASGLVVGPATWRALQVAAVFTLFYALWVALRLGGEEGLRYLSEVIFQFPPMIAAAACAFAALHCAGRERLGWAAFAAGNALWAVAE